MIFLPYIISLFIGYLLTHWFLHKDPETSFFLKLILSWGLGLGISSTLTFSSFVLFNHFQITWIIVSHILLAGALSYAIFKNPLRRQNLLPAWTLQAWPIYIILGVFVGMTILVIQASLFYPRGGWDAWQVWNFKARFLFLAGENWQNLFDPILWRSSPHYPLFLPLIHVWVWIFSGTPEALGPRLTTILFTILTAGLLSAALLQKTKNDFSALAGPLIISLPFFTLLATSQYCDIVLSFYLLAALVCLNEAQNKNHTGWVSLAGFMAGFLGFTKPEGLIAALILLGLVGMLALFSWIKKSQTLRPSHFGQFFLCFVLASLTTFAFQVLYSPGNQTFINGLTSTLKPSDLTRLQIILQGCWQELINKKWNGIWILVLLGILLGGTKCWGKKNLPLVLFLISYFGVILSYYQINTYFEIRWWISVTLDRILMSLLPAVLYWIFSALFEHDPSKQKSTTPE